MMKIDERLRMYAEQQKDTYVDDEKLQETVRKSKEAYWCRESEIGVSWLEFLYQQASCIQKCWWYAQGGVLLILWIVMSISESSFYTRRCIGILIPSFVILILPEFWKNKSNGAMEVEGTVYFSLNKIYAARTMLFAMVDVCLLSIFLIISSFTLQITLIDILKQFILPLNVTCCICFRSLCSKRTNQISFPLFYCLIWITVWTFVVLRTGVYENISVSVWCVMLGVSAVYLCYCIWRVCKSSRSYYENSNAIG